MPNVPVVDAPTQSQSGAPINISPPAGAFGANIVGDSLQQLGSTAGQISDSLARHAEQFQAINNKLDADKGAIANSNQLIANEEEFKFHNQGASASANMGAFLKTAEDNRAAIGDKMPNPMARAMFDADSRRNLQNATQRLLSFAVQQRQKDIEDTYNSSQATLTTQAAMNPANFDTDIKPQLMANAGAYAAQHGLTGDLFARQTMSKAIVDIADNLNAGGDALAAQAFIKTHQESMLPDVAAKALLRLKPAIMANEVDSDAQAIVAQATRPGSLGQVTADPHAFLTSILGEGVRVTSAARTPEHNAAVGGSPTSEHIPGNGVAYDLVPPAGTTTAQLAAHLHSTVPDAHQIIDEGDHVHIGWSQAQLNSHVANASVNSATGGPLTSAELQGRETHVIALADQQAEQRYPGNAVYRHQLETQAMQQLSMGIRAAKGTEDNNYASLADFVLQNNIQDKADLFRKMPNAANIYNSLPQSGRTALDSDIHRNGSEFTYGRQQDLTRATGMAATAKNGLPSDFLSQDFKDTTKWDLRTNDRIALVKEQQSIAAKPAKEDPNTKVLGQMTSAAAPEWTAILREQKIKKNSPDYFHLVGSVQSELDKWQDGHPEKVPDAKERMAILGRASAIQGTYHNSFLGISYGAAHPNTESDHPAHGTPRAYDVTPEERDGAIALLSKTGQAIDEQSIAHVVRRYRGGQ